MAKPGAKTWGTPRNIREQGAVPTIKMEPTEYRGNVVQNGRMAETRHLARDVGVPPHP